MKALKLCQGQVWSRAGEYLHIVRLERLKVEYKSYTDLQSRDGTRLVATKKDFCRLIRTARLLSPAELSDSPPEGSL